MTALWLTVLALTATTLSVTLTVLLDPLRERLQARHGPPTHTPDDDPAPPQA